jgi:hypothetical protein
MPSQIDTFDELERRLAGALDAVRRAAPPPAAAEVMAEIGAQLERLRAAARGGRRPPQALRDELDFGHLASRHAHAMDPALARELCEIASWVVYA